VVNVKTILPLSNNAENEQNSCVGLQLACVPGGDFSIGLEKIQATRMIQGFGPDKPA
jgi:hypothetical protein